MTDEKRNKIKNSLKETRDRRQHQACKVYSVKINQSKLNIPQSNWINKIFLEAKWFYNYSISRDDLLTLDTRLKNVKVINSEDKDEIRKLEYLSSQMKQELHSRILDNIKGLSILKKKGFKVGRIKFVRNINSIPLKQFKITWGIQAGRIKIQGLKKTLPVNGLDQIPEGVDFANAVLLRKPSGYYIQITTYQEKIERIKTGKSVGLDFGIKDNLVTSDGEKFNVKISESKKLKSLQRHFSRKVKGSKQRYKVLQQIKKEYEKIGNQKYDKVNKIVSYLKKEYDNIYIQDEMIKSWQSGLFGKQVQQSTLGAIKTRLKNLESVHIISRSYPTTKMCYKCGYINSIKLSDRIYKCSCGLEEDRDIKAAKTIKYVGEHKTLAGEHSNTLPENLTSVDIDSDVDVNKLNSLKEEDHGFLSRG